MSCATFFKTARDKQTKVLKNSKARSLIKTTTLNIFREMKNGNVLSVKASYAAMNRLSFNSNENRYKHYRPPVIFN